MKKLYLVRHAKSNRTYTELPDFERPLSYRGRTNAPMMGERLKGMGVAPDLILSSPATRALATARLIAEHLNYPSNKIKVVEEIYEAWLEDLLGVLKNIRSNHASVMLIGHNPGLRLLAEYFTEFPHDYIPTCGVLGIELPIDDWGSIDRDCGKALFFEVPKKNDRV